MRSLQHGEVGVSFFARGLDLPQREILPESKLMLLDRMYQPGDLLKRSIDDVRSGIVTRCATNLLLRDKPLAEAFYSIDVKGRLEHAITGEEIPGWKNKEDVDPYIDVDMGDYVVYEDWVGQVRAPHLTRHYLLRSQPHFQVVEVCKLCYLYSFVQIDILGRCLTKPSWK